jgi:hypothetical protein
MFTVYCMMSLMLGSALEINHIVDPSAYGKLAGTLFGSFTTT